MNIFSKLTCRKVKRKLSQVTRKRFFKQNTTVDNAPMPEQAFDSVYAFGKTIFKYNKFFLLLYLVFCTLCSMEQLVRNWSFRSFVMVIENFDPKSANSTFWEIIMWPSIGIVAAMLLVDLFYRVSNLLRAYIIRPNIEYSITKKVTSLLMGKKYHFFNKHPTSINNRIHQLTEGTYDAILVLSESVVPSCLAALVTIVAIFGLHRLMGCIVLLYCVFHVAIVWLFYKKYIRLSSCNATSHNILIRQTLNIIQNMSQVKGFGMEEFEKKRINIFQERRRLTNQKAFAYPERMKVALTMNRLLIFIISIYVQIELFLQGAFTIADIMFVMGSVYGIVQLLYTATDASVKMVEDIGRCEESVKFFRDSRIDNETKVKKRYPSKLNGDIVFQNVAFKYPNASKILFKNQNVVIKAGEKIGIVGLSGSGKSTFVNLIMGYFLPISGNVTVGGYKTDATDLSWLRRHITMMSQSPQLFDRTVLANIKYGNYKLKYKQIIDIANKLGMKNFIKDLPFGLYTQVADGGKNLSGGQKQIIAIARAATKESQIIVLDEATSSMDSHTQAVVNKGIEKLVKNKTVIVIAHKLETVVNTDRIFVFKSGTIIEQGTHEELTEKEGSYYRYLWRLSMSNSYSS
ncbi:MAG: ABC transporter ATP-binding protein [Alphaproteobacteria bacterium]|nr:ABC transporter ATP-binding protein [Rickettsiales bacterium]